MCIAGLSAFRFLRCLPLLTLLVAGCGASDALPGLNTQISQVKAGTSSTIVLEQAPGVEDFARLAKMDGLKKIEIQAGEVTVEKLELLSQCSSLEHLIIKSEINSAQLRVISRCEMLRVLNVPNGTFDDAAFQQLAALKHLELLRAGSAALTDQCMHEIRNFLSLRFLHLIGAPVTDDGLEALYDVTQLESLYIDESQVTDVGIGQLVEARRDLHVHVNQQHPDRADGHSHEH